MKNDRAVPARREKILVTGANGFLGRHVARLFAKKGFEIVGIGHGEWTREDWAASGLSDWHCTDVTLEALQRYAGKPEAILHCAGSGSVGFSIHNPLEDFQRTVATTAHVLEYVRLFSPATRVVYPSSASVYGSAEVLPIHEDCRTAPISQYGVHKLMAEQAVASFSRQFGISASIVRLFSVYGRGLRKQLLWDACRKFAAQDTVFMGTGDEVRDWLHVEDAARLMFAATQHASPDCPTVNGGSGEGITVRLVLEHLSVALLQHQVDIAFSGIQRAGDPNRYIADLTRAKRWGWHPERQWQDGVTEYAEWWRQWAGKCEDAIPC